MFIEEYKINEIINELEKKNYKTSSGNKRFSPTVIRTILRNEKYMGDMKLQKTTVKSIGARNSVINTTKPIYYVSNNHKGIIDKKDFHKVQSMIQDRNKLYKPKSNKKINEHKYSNFVYSLPGDKFYKSKINHRGKPYQVMLLELLDNKKNRVLDIKNIYYSQIDILIEEALKSITKNISYFKNMVTSHFEKSKDESPITLQMKNIEELIIETKQKEKAITSSRIIDSAKKEMMAKFENEIDTLNIQLVELNHKHIMAFNYEGGLRLFMKQLKNINDYEAKDIFLSVVATDRENLNIILKLSNQSDLDIDYNTILKTNPIYTGSYEFIQTRLNLNVSWKLFLT